MIAHLDCSSGISGDKFLGALIDAGLPSDELCRALEGLGAPEVVVSSERVERGSISATAVTVSASSQPPMRAWRDIRRMLEAGPLPTDVRDRALSAFTLIAETEARIHGVEVDDVHFHELGAIDTIADIVGVAMGLGRLGVTELVCTPVAVGSGTIERAHGVLPVPAPATGELLVGVPVVPGPASGELTTPTGAALVREFATSFGPLPAMIPTTVAYGAGAREIPTVPNVARLLLGESPREQTVESVVLLETNIDHIPAEQLAFGAEELLAEGSLDVWQTPIVMKKGRAAVTLSALVHEADAERIAARMQDLTGTLGVRRIEATRSCLEREIVDVDSPWGPARVKVGGRAPCVRPEHDDVARIARETGLAYGEVRDTIVTIYAARRASERAE